MNNKRGYNMRVLLVEDEIKLTQALKHIANKENINMDIANDGLEGLYMAEKMSYDVIILDIMLPGMNGLEILKHLRDKSLSVPILLLTARGSVEDKVNGLNLGADDYLPKPFATQELFARIKALSRRINTEYQGNTFSFGNMVFYKDLKKLIINQEEIQLPKKESEIIEMFMRNPKQILTREQILDKVWGYDTDVTENNIEICIYHLRKKMGNDAGAVIRTIRGTGYLLEEKKDV